MPSMMAFLSIILTLEGRIMAMIRNWRWLTLMAILVLGLGLLVGYRQLAAVELTRISPGELLIPHDLSSLAEEYP